MTACTGRSPSFARGTISSERPQRISPGMRYEVRLRRGASVDLAGGLSVSRTGRLTLGLPRLAEPAAKPPGCSGRADGSPGAVKLFGQRQRQWWQARLARRAGCRVCLRAAPDRAVDARLGLAGPDASAWRAHGPRRATCRVDATQHPRSAVCNHRGEPKMGGRFTTPHAKGRLPRASHSSCARSPCSISIASCAAPTAMKPG